MSEEVHKEIIKILKTNDLYEILGVKEDVTTEDLKIKYRKVI